MALVAVPPGNAARAAALRVYCIFFTFFFSLIAGGVMLVSYFLLPTDDIPDWLDLAGLGICAFPWLFWFLTYLYRTYAYPSKPAGPSPPMRSATVAPVPQHSDNSPANVVGGNAEEQDCNDCPGKLGTVDVRWAQAVLMEIDEDDEYDQAVESRRSSDAAAGDGDERNMPRRHEREGSSHDSEKPLALSMAS